MPISNEKILDIKGLNLTYDVNYFKTSSVRDLFIKTFKSPFHFLDADHSFHALKNVDLEINKGDVLGIIGKNGSGKTSLCRVISGMLPPHSGLVDLNGTVRSIFNTSVGIIPELTGRENAILLGSLIYPEIDDEKLMSVVEDAIDFSELGHFIDTPFLHYSKGMQARLSLSVISTLPADLLILDEVYDGADKAFKEKISLRVDQMIKDSGAVLFVGHDLEQIQKICNKLAVLKDGKILYFGENIPKGIYIYEEGLS
jgi:ABC-type polysaccharide/polyol phosphate transport system ATPase subunit